MQTLAFFDEPFALPVARFLFAMTAVLRRESKMVGTAR